MTASRLTCERCTGVIGVYEPLVVVTDGEARETSRAAEPTPPLEPAEHYRRACYLEPLGAVAA